MTKAPSREIDELFERYRRAPGSHVFAPLADAYRKLGLLEEALDICARGISANPKYASGYVVQGKCQYDAGRAERAEDSFKKVLSLDAQNLVALRYLGIIRAGNGDSDGARAYFEQILVLDPDDKDIQLRLEMIREASPVPTPAAASTETAAATDELPSIPSLPTAANVDARDGDDDDDNDNDDDGDDDDDDEDEDDDDDDGDGDGDDEEVMELRDVRDEFEGAPILLGDDSATTEYIATVTLADIFASQGYSAKALKIYEDVLRRQPANEDVRRKIRSLGGDIPEPANPPTVELDAKAVKAAVSPPPTKASVAPPTPTPPAPVAATPAQPPAVPPATPASSTAPTIDEGRSYEQFKRWLRTVSD
jgi:tetratricopeptide (TPR) repeat protein